MRKAKYLGDASDFQVRWGSNDDPRGLLQDGQEYEVERVEVHTQHTKIHLKEFPGKRFNSVHFDLDIEADIETWRRERGLD